MDKHLDIYTTYLQISFGQATATGLSALLDGAISHDAITDLLSANLFDNKRLWLEAKPLVRAHESADAVLIFDDTIIEKPYTDENEIVNWYFDHKTNRTIKGINLLTMLYHSLGAGQSTPLQAPVGAEIVHKDILYCDLKTRRERRRSSVTKNELLRRLYLQARQNRLRFGYVAADSWYASTENMKYIAQHHDHFIFELKSNRSVSMTAPQPNVKTQWQRLDQLTLTENTPINLWLKDLDLNVCVCKQIFKNGDGSVGERYLVSNDLNLTAERFAELYQKRWSVEVYHKSIKQNAAIAQSPTRTERTQTNHCFAALFAYIKFEALKFSQNLNQFALKAKLYLEALKAALHKLNQINAATSCVT